MEHRIIKKDKKDIIKDHLEKPESLRRAGKPRQQINAPRTPPTSAILSSGEGDKGGGEEDRKTRSPLEQRLKIWICVCLRS